VAITLKDMPELEGLLPPMLDGCTFEESEHGASGSRVIRVSMKGSDVAYVKYASGDFADELREEYERIEWLRSRARVPEVIDYRATPNAAVLVTRALVGRNGMEASSLDPAAVVSGMARALSELHSIPPAECPFDEGLPRRLKQAFSRMEAGRVDEEDFDQSRLGMPARVIFDSLLSCPPMIEHPVVTHGDACPENFIFREGAFVGFIDCGRAGRADRYQDLALASRNIGAIFGPALVDHFFVEYGEPDPDPARIEYYRILDEFF
jgi:aminoglycoside phosphotransferase